MYLHIYLYRLWQNLGQLPSVFHDGTPLDQAVSPWIVTGYVRFHQRHGVQKPSVLGVAQKWLTALLVWWLAPITLVLIWARYLVRHDWGGTLLHVVLVAIAVFGAVLLHRFAKAGLCRRERPMESRAGKALGFIGLVAVGAMTFVLSKSAIDLSKGSVGGHGPPFAWTRPTTWVEAALNVIDMAPCADLQRADLSGADLSGADLRCADLREAKLGQSGSDRRDGSTRLVGTDLRGADLTGAVLVGANLKGVRLDRARLGNANLQQAQLPEASLSQANLKDAVLCYADLGFADLADARLSGANLYGADLVNVDLRGAGLSHADLRDTNLSNAKLQDAELPDASLDQAILHRANFEGADLGHARLDFADLKFAKGLTQEQLDQACGKNVYNMPNGLTIGPCTEAAETRELACGAP